MAHNWLAAERGELAAERILDAAGELFAAHDVAAVGMREIADAAGCSRATLYRYFASRDALHRAYADREGHRLYQDVGSQIDSVGDPGERLVAAILATVRMVRAKPALASWFVGAHRPIGGELAERSEGPRALAERFLRSLRPGDPGPADQRARWLVRVVTSLLVFPGEDDNDERAMVENFVVPTLLPLSPTAGAARDSAALGGPVP